jgi:hypothetical protein
LDDPGEELNLVFVVFFIATTTTTTTTTTTAADTPFVFAFVTKLGTLRPAKVLVSYWVRAREGWGGGGGEALEFARI